MQPSTPAAATAVLLIHCPDQKGIVATITNFIATNRGNIVYMDQHVDPDEQMFFMRLEWELADFAIPPETIAVVFQKAIADPFRMQWSLYFSHDVPRMAIFVSHRPHCLYDLLSRLGSTDWRVEVPLVISNHETLKPAADRFGIEYLHFPITPSTKAAQEQAIADALAARRIDFIVLARYMQILTPFMIERYPHRIINIHHSFLPAFPGARPYHSAHQRGVKIIGATSHYVTANLDEGPIIEQDVERITHRDSIENLRQKGEDLEKRVLARAVKHHFQHRILVCQNKTVVFS